MNLSACTKKPITRSNSKSITLTKKNVKHKKKLMKLFKIKFIYLFIKQNARAYCPLKHSYEKNEEKK